MDFLAGGAGQAALTGWLMWKRVGILLMMAESRSWGRLVAPITITCVTPRDTTETSAGKHPQAGNVSTSHGISLTLSIASTFKEVTKSSDLSKGSWREPGATNTTYREISA